MAKLGNDPDSATSQWFVNLADNSTNLDFQNGGFTVFAKILSGGMAVFDAIAALQRVDFGNDFLGGAFSRTPAVNFNGSQSFQIENFVLIDKVELHDVTGIFNDNALSFVVETSNNSFFDVQLQLVAVEPDIVFELDTTSISSLPAGSANMATFSVQDRTLLISSIMVNKTTIVSNVVMLLTDPANFQFTLVSFE